MYGGCVNFRPSFVTVQYCFIYCPSRIGSPPPAVMVFDVVVWDSVWAASPEFCVSCPDCALSGFSVFPAAAETSAPVLSVLPLFPASTLSVVFSAVLSGRVFCRSSVIQGRVHIQHAVAAEFAFQWRDLAGGF